MCIGFRRLAAVTFALGAALLAGCGTPGAPQPPSLKLPKPVDDLRIARKGDTLTLSWTPVTQTTDGVTLKHAPEVRVCHAVNQKSLAVCEAPSTVTPQPLPTNSKRVFAEQTIPAAEIGDTNYGVYAVQLVNDRGRSAGLSNQVLAPLAASAGVRDASASLQQQIGGDVAVEIRFQSVSGACDVRVYRREQGAEKEILLPDTSASCAGEGPKVNLATGATILDPSFEWEKTYTYRIAAVTAERLPNGQTVRFEGPDSQPVTITTHDVFPPPKPTGLQAVFSGGLPGQPNAIDLTWEPNTEKDLAGYSIYRRDDGQPPSTAVKLNSDPVKTPAFRDATVQPGHRYLYSVTAVDQRKNESDRSADAAESVPQQ